MDVTFESTVRTKKGVSGFPDLFVLRTTDKRMAELVGQRVKVLVKVKP